MTTPVTDPPPRAGLVQRYGPLTGIVVALALVAVLVTVNGDERAAGVGTTAGSAGAPVEAADLPVPYEKAKSEGRERAVTWVRNCDPATGRIRMPTLYAPPCVPEPTGPNGGAIAPGVTADTVTVVYYRPPDNGDLLAALAGNLDARDAVRDTVDRYVEMLGALATTYGRKVEVKFFDANGAADDALAARAEAQEVIDTYHPFASINGPGLTPAYAEELKAQGVLCIACGTALADQAFQDNAPYLWGVSASPEQWVSILSEYIGRRLAGRPAKWAGDEGLRRETRKFGVVNFEQDPPQFGALSTVGESCEDVTGWTMSVHETYLATSMNDRAPTIIAKLKAARVTSVIFMGDPVMPMTLTAEATKQQYFPEWIVTGTALTDLSLFGRKYDQRQWQHAFGLSQLAVDIPRDQRDDVALHQWYFGREPTAEKTSGVVWPPLLLLFNGIHMAGPTLTPETFARGLFNLPPAGGGPTTPRVSYGTRGTFPILDPATCQRNQARPDYLGTDDMVEVWWDPDAGGPDEQGSTEQTGRYRHANGGRRYLPGQMPETEADAFKVEGSVIELDTRPPSDRAPDYPPPGG